jgi:hypothetical protein
VEQSDEAGKSPLLSKTIHFNLLAWAVWPFLPAKFKQDPNAPLVVAAWFSIGNIVLRFVTSTAIVFWGKRAKEKNQNQN